MVDSGALDALVPCLEEFDPTVKEAAGWAIGYIAQHNAGTHNSQTGIRSEHRGSTTVEKGEGGRGWFAGRRSLRRTRGGEGEVLSFLGSDVGSQAAECGLVW